MNSEFWILSVKETNRSHFETEQRTWSHVSSSLAAIQNASFELLRHPPYLPIVSVSLLCIQDQVSEQKDTAQQTECLMLF